MDLGGTEWLIQLSVGKTLLLTNLLLQFSESNDILTVKLYRYISFSLSFVYLIWVSALWLLLGLHTSITTYICNSLF